MKNILGRISAKIECVVNFNSISTDLSKNRIMKKVCFLLTLCIASALHGAQHAVQSLDPDEEQKKVTRSVEQEWFTILLANGESQKCSRAALQYAGFFKHFLSSDQHVKAIPLGFEIGRLGCGIGCRIRSLSPATLYPHAVSFEEIYNVLQIIASKPQNASLVLKNFFSNNYLKFERLIEWVLVASELEIMPLLEVLQEYLASEIVQGHIDIEMVAQQLPNDIQTKIMRGYVRNHTKIRGFLQNSELLKPKTLMRGVNVQSLSYSPDGTKIAVGLFGDSVGSSCKVCVITEQGELLRKIEIAGTPLSLSWSPDSKEIVVGTNFSGVIIINLDTGACRQLSGDGSAKHVKWSLDGKYIAVSSSASWVCNIQIWEVGSSRMVQEHKLAESFDSIYSMCWSPDSSKIGVGVWDEKKEIYILNVSDQKSIPSILEPSWDFDLSDHRPLFVRWLSSGTIIAATTHQGFTYLWDVTSKKQLAVVGYKGQVQELSPCNTNIVFITSRRDGHSLTLWDMEAQEILQVIPGQAGELADWEAISWSPQGEKIVLGFFSHRGGCNGVVQINRIVDPELNSLSLDQIKLLEIIIAAGKIPQFSEEEQRIYASLPPIWKEIFAEQYAPKNLIQRWAPAVRHAVLSPLKKLLRECRTGWDNMMTELLLGRGNNNILAFY